MELAKHSNKERPEPATQSRCSVGYLLRGGLSYGIGLYSEYTAMTLPITDEQAKAITALSTFGTTTVTAGSDLARFVVRIVGTTAEDAVGLIIGDPLRAIRTLAAGWYDTKVQEILEGRRVKQTQPVSLSVALPLMQGAYDESRKELRELWAQLLAAAMDPERSGQVRLSFIETLKRFDPLDARLLKARYIEQTIDMRPNTIEFFASKLQATPDEVLISSDNLRSLGCFVRNTLPAQLDITPYGRGLLRACSD